MPHHIWGEENFDWKGLDDAGWYISGSLKRWGRVPVRQTKEKYGELRIYLSFGWESFHTITHPGYCFSQYPKWLWRLNYTKPVSWFFEKLNKIIVPYHMFLYRYFYRKAVQKWPHLALEIINGADYHELLMGISPEFDKYHKEHWSCKDEH